MNQKVSVILPIYNAEKYLVDTLNCIVRQTYENLEIICILDGSTDSSEEIVRKFAASDKRIKIVKHEKNMNLPIARNTGASNATAEYIHFIDSDDLLSPDFYERLLSAAIKEDADVAACSVFYEKKPKHSIWFKNETVSGKDKIIKSEVLIHGWAWRYLIRRTFWNKHNFSFPNLRPLEDMPVMIPMIYYANKVALCSDAVYFYKNREGSILRAKYNPEKEKLWHENRHAARKIFHDFLREHNIKRPSRFLYLLKHI